MRSNLLKYPENYFDLIVIDVSATGKIVPKGEELKLVENYSMIYDSSNYEIYKR